MQNSLKTFKFLPLLLVLLAIACDMAAPTSVATPIPVPIQVPTSVPTSVPTLVPTSVPVPAHAKIVCWGQDIVWGADGTGRTEVAFELNVYPNGQWLKMPDCPGGKITTWDIEEIAVEIEDEWIWVGNPDNMGDLPGEVKGDYSCFEQEYQITAYQLYTCDDLNFSAMYGGTKVEWEGKFFFIPYHPEEEN